MTVQSAEDIVSGLVHVRTTAYKRPELLERCLRSLTAQTWADWVCDVYDDDPEQGARLVCDSLGDARIRYTPNRVQKFASRNIDACFTSDNPHRAEFFFVLEDDNYVFDDFMAANIALCRRHGVEVVLRNQVVDYDLSGRGRRMSTFGVLDAVYPEGVQTGETIRLGALPGIGVSNGGVFWSARARTDFEIGFACNASLQEYLRTFAIVDDAYVALEPLAAWASNGEQTMRNHGDRAGYLKRELDLKRAIQTLRREIWRTTSKAGRAALLRGERLPARPSVVAEALRKALIAERVEGARVSLRETVTLTLRGLLIATAGHVDPELRMFLARRGPNASV